MADRTREQRALARANWPIERHRLSDETDDVLRSVEPAACVAMVWTLTLDAWASSGTAIPDYERAAAPGRVVRRGPS